MENLELTDLEREIIRLLEGCQGEANALRRRNLCEILIGLADERKVRRAIKHLVMEHGIPIASTCSGYFTPVTPDEIVRASKYYHSYAMACLTAESRLRKCSMADLIGQIKLNFTAESAENVEET